MKLTNTSKELWKDKEDGNKFSLPLKLKTVFKDKKMCDPDDFELKEDDSKVVRAFKLSKTHMWFREPIEDPNAVYNNLR